MPLQHGLDMGLEIDFDETGSDALAVCEVDRRAGMENCRMQSPRPVGGARMKIVRTARWLVPAALVVSVLGFAQKPEEAVGGDQDPSPQDLDAIRAASELHYALHRKSYDEALAAMLLTQDIDMIEQTTGMTALGVAARDESADAIDMVQPLVLRCGADPRVVDAGGYTALHYAAAAGNLAVVQFLVEMGAEVDVANPLKEARTTPLAMAYRRGRSRIVEFLISHGAQEFDTETKTSFELEAALKAAETKWSERRLRYRRDDDLQREYRNEARAKTSVYVRALEEIGRMDVAESMQESNARLLKAIESTPAEPGMSRSDYRERVQARVEEEGSGAPRP